MSVNAYRPDSNPKPVAYGEPVARSIATAARACVIVPAYQAAPTIESVLDEIARSMPELAATRDAIIVIDDGSTDATADLAARAGAHVVSHGKNRGKGAALATGLGTAKALGFDVALTVDADGQHPGDSARAVLYGTKDPHALVLGVRNLVRAGAPKANRFSNGLSNFFLSHFASRWGYTRALADTQCGLRRYPVRETLALTCNSDGFAFEAEVLLRAIAAQVAIVEVPVVVRYPETRTTHFNSVKDPARIVAIVVRTLHELG